MNLAYEYYSLLNNHDVYPAWVESEKYFNCEHFSKIIRFFTKRF
ncbi:hypothetical protein [uncultured Thomasclavelia sp.]|nr:hypothetical protein [uncultured Thomasclavelia sp.]